jgi:exopolysaccharide biosynthesis polyprenyl glycosylphosphotransferase
MIKHSSEKFTFLSVLLDWFLVMAALRIAQLIRPGLSDWAIWIKDFAAPPEVGLLNYLLFPLVWVSIFFLFSVYDPNKHLKFSEELSSLLGGCVVALVILPGMLYFVNREMSRVLFVSFAMIASVLLISYRVLFYLVINKTINETYVAKRILFIGAGVVGRNIGNTIEQHKRLGFKIIGYLDDDQAIVEQHADVLGTLDQVDEIITAQNVGYIIIALPRRAYDRIESLVTKIHQRPVRVWVIPDYFSLALNEAVITEFAGFPLIDLRAPALNKYQRLLKRAFDMLITIPLFILTSPLLAIIAMLIKADSSGPVFHKSKRIKENGEVFGMLKFRTMVQGAEQKLEEVISYDDEGHMIHKHPDDPRVTKIGKVLRRFSLDELPQFINIIRGEMSLVGPRPELPQMVDLYKPWQRARFSVPQGLTGWWQITGRSDKPMHLHTDEDIYYIKNYSIWLDIQILIRTVWVVLKGKGAY